MMESGEVLRGANPSKKTLFITLYPNLVSQARMCDVAPDE
jgi:hypothetical protein